MNKYQISHPKLTCLLLAMWLFAGCTTSAGSASTNLLATSSGATSNQIEPVVAHPPQTSTTTIPTEIPTPLPTPTAKATKIAGGTVRISEIDGVEQVYVDPGEFIMGAPEGDPFAKATIEGGRAYEEIPQFTLYLDGFWIDKYEVTNAAYAKCVAAGACKPPNLVRSFTRDSYYGNPEFDNYPVLYVDWYMAGKYCAWAGKRLPTEAEWEKAARGTDGRRYPWGNEDISGEHANFCDINCPKSHANPNYNDGYADTAPVGSYSKGASPYGAMDMAGNVWEWTSTIVMPYPYNAHDGREDPNVSGVGGERVWRGGPWSNGIWWQRATIRYRSVQWYWYGNLGFRCASSQ